MRKDMSKVVTTPPRAGGNTKKNRTYDRKSKPREKRYVPGRRDVYDDFSPKRESMRKRHVVGGDEKYFTDHIQPLRRYLRSQVGRPWNDVWAEVCQNLKGGGMNANHIRNNHVKDEVGGIPHSGETYFRNEDWFQGRYPGSLYVDEQGILCQVPESKRFKIKKQKFHYYRESDTVEYHKHNGAWFRVEVVWYDEPREIYSYRGKTFVPYLVYYVETKRTLSKKEVKALDLENRFEYQPPRITLE